MALKFEIAARLRTRFTSAGVEVIDESESHRGHSGYQEGGESHWRVIITDASDLAPLSRIARHRAVHDAIGKDILTRIHALAIEIR